MKYDFPLSDVSVFSILAVVVSSAYNLSNEGVSTYLKQDCMGKGVVYLDEVLEASWSAKTSVKSCHLQLFS